TLNLQASDLIFIPIPLVFEILLEEVTIADPADFRGHLVAVFQILAMLPQGTTAILRIGLQISSPRTEIVVARVVDAPSFGFAECIAVDAEKVVAVIAEAGAATWSAFAEVINV